MKGYVDLNEKNILLILKTASQLLLKDFEKYCFENYIKKPNLNNFYLIYESSKTFMRKEMFHYAEKAFEFFVQNEYFCKMDLSFVTKLLSSSQLNLSNEIQVFKAANSWLKYSFNERSKHASYILSKVRLSLLSLSELNVVQDEILAYKFDNSFRDSLKTMIKSKQSNLLTLPNHNLRSNSHYKFNIIVCGGQDKRGKLEDRKMKYETYMTKGDDFSQLNEIGPLTNPRMDHFAVDLGKHVYIFGGYDGNYRQVMSVEAFSKDTNSWEVVSTLPDNRKYFSACGFMGKIYIIGGAHNEIFDLYTCVVYDPKKGNWNEIANMNEARSYSHCTVFNGKVVVSGGSVYNNVFREPESNTVEYFDFCNNKWQFMSKMIRFRHQHQSIGIKNKLYLLGGARELSCEVFDMYTKTSTFLKKPSISIERYNSSVLAIGNRILVIRNDEDLAEYFDVENKKWTKMDELQLFKKFSTFCCVKSIQL